MNFALDTKFSALFKMRSPQEKHELASIDIHLSGTLGITDSGLIMKHE